jgi:beta-lactamase regulating signal transducer with metallopeptidase domain
VAPADRGTGGFEARYAPAERQLALDHERYHHARGDILANHIALIVLAATWFNPISWIAFRAFRADQELSCDAAIAAEASADMRSHYARALVKSASRPGPDRGLPAQSR